MPTCHYSSGGLSVSRGPMAPTLTFAFLLSPWKATKTTKRPPLATHSSRQSVIDLSIIISQSSSCVRRLALSLSQQHWPGMPLWTNAVLAKCRETCCFLIDPKASLRCPDPARVQPIEINYKGGWAIPVAIIHTLVFFCLFCMNLGGVFAAEREFLSLSFSVASVGLFISASKPSLELRTIQSPRSETCHVTLTCTSPSWFLFLAMMGH